MVNLGMVYGIPGRQCQVPPGERFSLPLARAYAALSQAAFCTWDAAGDGTEAEDMMIDA